MLPCYEVIATYDDQMMDAREQVLTHTSFRLAYVTYNLKAELYTVLAVVNKGAMINPADTIWR